MIFFDQDDSAVTYRPEPVTPLESRIRSNLTKAWRHVHDEIIAAEATRDEEVIDAVVPRMTTALRAITAASAAVSRRGTWHDEQVYGPIPGESTARARKAGFRLWDHKSGYAFKTGGPLAKLVRGDVTRSATREDGDVRLFDLLVHLGMVFDCPICAQPAKSDCTPNGAYHDERAMHALTEITLAVSDF